jgi:hypothetical protein
MIHWDRLLAILLIGVSSLVLIAVDQIADAMFLLGAMAVWAFKNGIQSNAPTATVRASSPTEKPTTASDSSATPPIVGVEHEHVWGYP